MAGLLGEDLAPPSFKRSTDKVIQRDCGDKVGTLDQNWCVMALMQQT